MFNRIRQTVGHTDERCVPMSRHHRFSVPIGPAGTPRDRVARHRFTLAEAL